MGLRYVCRLLTPLLIMRKPSHALPELTQPQLFWEEITRASFALLGETTTSGWACLVCFLAAFLLQLQLQGAWCHSKMPCWGCTQGCALFSFVLFFFGFFVFFFPKGKKRVQATLDARKKCEALQDYCAKPEKLKDSPSILIRTNKQKYLLLCYPKNNNKLDRHCSHQKIQGNAILLQENVTWKDVWY